MGAESLAKKRKKYANLITPTLLNIDFFSCRQEIRIEDDHPNHDNYVADTDQLRPTKHSQQRNTLYRSQTFSPVPQHHEEGEYEEEKDFYNQNLGQSYFEKISVELSVGSDQMAIEDNHNNNNNKNSSLREEDIENFEYEELDLSATANQIIEEEFSLNGNGFDPTIRYKVIGNEVFEYEEL